MLNFLLVLLSLTIFLIIPTTINAYAIEIEADFWFPEKMLVGETYNGLIILKDTLSEPITMDIITDNDSIIELTSSTLTINEGNQHGIIEIKTKGIGTAEIFAIHDGQLSKKNVNVVVSAAVPTKLTTIIPKDLFNVLQDDNSHTGYIFLLNDFDNPVKATKPIDVILTSNGDIILQKQTVTIPQGMHYAKFDFTASAEGSIASSAQNLEPSSVDLVVSNTQKVELKVAVAPEPIPTSSSAEIYYWLEKDGKPFVATHDVKVSITISESDIMSFDSSMRGTRVISEENMNDEVPIQDSFHPVKVKTNEELKRDASQVVYLKSGEHFGKVQSYTSASPGTTKITATAISFGNISDEEKIQDSTSTTISLTKIDETSGKNSALITKTNVMALPNPAFDKVDIIVSASSDNGPVFGNNDEEFSVFVSSELDEIKTKGKISPDRNYSIVSSSVKDFGAAEIIAEINDAAKGESTVSLKTRFVNNPDISITPLPILYGVEQDLFLITSTHSQPKFQVTNGFEQQLLSITTKPIISFSTSTDDESIITVKGIATTSQENPYVYVSSNAFTETEQLEIYNHKRKTLYPIHPSQVFSEESFPVITHVADMNKNPVNIANVKISSEVELQSTSDKLVMINDTGNFNLIFFEENSIPAESSISVTDGVVAKNTQAAIVSSAPPAPTVTKYLVEVDGGEGSGIYLEDEEVTLKAKPVIQDGIIRKVFAYWEDLPYTDAEITFEIDDNIETKPIYRDDYSILFAIGGVIASVGGLVFFRKKFSRKLTSIKPKKKKSSSKKDLEDSILDEIEKL